MTNNPILAELRRTRRELLAEYAGDAAAYLQDAKKRLEASDRVVAKRDPKPIKKNVPVEHH